MKKNWLTGMRGALSGIADVMAPYRHDKAMFFDRWEPLIPAIHQQLRLVPIIEFGHIRGTGDDNDHRVGAIRVMHPTKNGRATLLELGKSGTYDHAEAHLLLVGQHADQYRQLKCYALSPQYPDGKVYMGSVDGQRDALTRVMQWQEKVFGRAVSLPHADADAMPTVMMAPSGSNQPHAKPGR